ncbi:MAG: FG-GAP repeat domain-containing protein, partial [Candidatus Saccharimonadales bacterium]
GASLENIQSAFAILTPDLPGYYQISPNDNLLAGAIGPNWAMVSVGADAFLGEPVPFGSYGTFVEGLTCGNFDRSGLPSIAMIGSDGYFKTEVSLWLRSAKSSYLFDDVEYLNNSQEANARTGDGVLNMDFNDDGQSDIVAEDWVGTTVYLSQPDGTYLPLTLGLPTGQTNMGIAISILDASNSANSRAITISDSKGATPGLYTYVWNGTGFNSAVVDSSAIPASVSIPPFTEADVTGDGYADAVFCVDYVTGNAQLAVEPGDGSGSFGTATYFNLSGTSCQNLKTADLNGDGREDVFVADGTNLDVFLQSSSGTLNAKSALSLTGEASDMVVTDLSGDRHLDIIVLQGASQQIGIFWGSNAGPIGPEYTEGILFYGDGEYLYTDNGAQLSSCDFNSDGIADVAFESDGSLYIMYGEYIN